jgi:hypothetical protein
MTAEQPKTDAELVVLGGYAPTIALNPQKVTHSQGYKQALEDLGFTVNNAQKVVTEILLNPEERSDTRLNAAKEVFKVHGAYAPEKSTSTNVNVNVDMTPEDKASLLSLLNDKGGTH